MLRKMSLTAPICGVAGLGRRCVVLGVLAVAGDIAWGLRRVASCASVHANECLGGWYSHILLVIGAAGILGGWRLLVDADRRAARPLSQTLKVVALVLLPVLATVGDWAAESLLNPSDNSWDGRPVPIRLAVLILAPAALTLATGALARGRWLVVIALTITSAAVSYVLPFAAPIGYMALLSGGSAARVLAAISVATVAAFTWRRRAGHLDRAARRQKSP